MSTARKKALPITDPTLRERATAARASLAKDPSETGLEQRYGNARYYADGFDFAPFTLVDVARLYEITRQIGDHLSLTTNMPLCTYRDANGYLATSPLGWFLNFETERLAFLRDRCVAELERRQPRNGDECDESLGARLAHELDCNGRIAEPGLLLEALKAWG